MLLDYRNFLRLSAAAVLLLGASASIVHAQDDDGRMPGASNSKWQSECGACHVAFPPRLLPAESWRAMMSGLDKHFGSDASLDAATSREIGDFLQKNASGGKYAKSDKPLLRITETRWFIREHDEVAQHTWTNPKVKSPANCAACHIKAESGNYSEDDIRIPR